MSERRVQKIISLYTSEFTLQQRESCFVISAIKKSIQQKKHIINTHRSSLKHQLGVETLKKNGAREQSFLKPKKSEFMLKITKAFALCDILFWKLVNSDMKELFSYMGFQPPSRESLRQYLINNYCSYIVDKVIRLLEKQKIFLVVDESEINETKFFNIMTGLISNPKAIFFVKDCFN
ncbi:hypothetical protein CDIK_3508 [Cucumispora dikerogammari]|nr:hypothetical protein CDIK_3508 [Cucumispora dikerogammari]